MDASPATPYRGRIAPTPSGRLHIGHARTFHTAWQRARDAGGAVIYRDEDLDRARWRPEYAIGAMEDLRWLGLDWDEGPDVGGPHAPYRQSERRDRFLGAWKTLCATGAAYPSPHSRRQVAAENPVPAPNGEPLFPTVLRCPPRPETPDPGGVNWRFRVPDGRTIRFTDGRCGQVALTAGVDFGDFLIWRRDGMPAYELAVVVDDREMAVTEVVRGEDLLVSTARQILLQEALGFPGPRWYHTPLVCRHNGERLSKTAGSLGIHVLRDRGWTPRRILDLPQRLPAELG